MADRDNISYTEFDKLVSGKRLLILKAALPYISPKNQKAIAIYIKVEELKNTLNLPAKAPILHSSDSFIDEIKKYLDESQLESFEMFDTIMSMMSMFKESSGDSGEGGNIDPYEFIMNMMAAKENNSD